MPKLRNEIQALSDEAVRHIKAEAYAEVGESDRFLFKCLELAFDYPHYAKAVEISRSFNIPYWMVIVEINNLIYKAREQRDKYYEKERDG